MGIRSRVRAFASRRAVGYFRKSARQTLSVISSRERAERIVPMSEWNGGRVRP
jgi:hypothetical protein